MTFGLKIGIVSSCLIGVALTGPRNLYHLI